MQDTGDKLAVQVQQEQVTEATLYDTVAALTSDETFLREELQNEPVRVKVIRGPWSKGVQICSPGGVQICSPRAEADHWVFQACRGFAREPRHRSRRPGRDRRASL